MKILVSAFSCAPNAGSELGVGWRWALELSKRHEVVVVTDASRRRAIEEAMASIPRPALRFEYFRPGWLSRIPLNSATAHILYVLWQISLLPFALRLHRKNGFDFALHLTYGVFRHPSFLGFLGIPFVFGPVGGGEDAPWALKQSLTTKDQFKEVARAIANKLALLDPMLWVAYRSAALIAVKTAETRLALPWPFRKRAVVFPEIGIDPRECAVTERRSGDPLQVLFAGRLLGWKGGHLAIRAVAEARKMGRNVVLTIVGSGPYGSELRRLAERLGVESCVRWVSHVPQDQLFQIYSRSHCFLFPSLHDSSGNVVLEAQSFGLPIICLDLGGPKTLTVAESAIVVATSSRTEEDVVASLAEALCALEMDEARRQRMSHAAASHAAGMSWGNRVSKMLELVDERCFPAGRAVRSAP
ncbi:glycosyltransferase family 4 protein [Lysobacter sp. P5_B9]